MSKIARHATDAELVREGVARKKKTLAELLDAAGDYAGALSLVLGAAHSYAGYLDAAGAKTAELCRALGLGAEAASAIFALGSGSGSVSVSFPLGSRRLSLPATGPTDSTHAGDWRVGWWLAQIVRDRDAIDRLVSTPVDVLRRSSTRGDECQYLFIEALQGFERRAPDWSDRLQAALDATDPTRVRLSDEEFVLNVLVPEMQMVFRLALGETGPFDEAVEFALERHRKYWSKGNRKQDPDGFLALGALGICSIAHDAGVPVAVESDYMPRELVEGACRRR
ncbi:MAG TPA: immunity 49 family protein [Rhodanobacteraceae bacterium]|nr:immunity 49 family protein [Rhodanobacteraceae bacterium]